MPCTPKEIETEAELLITFSIELIQVEDITTLTEICKLK